MKTLLAILLGLCGACCAADSVAITSADGKSTVITITIDTTPEQAQAAAQRARGVIASQVKTQFTQAVLTRASQFLATSAQTAAMLPSDIDAQAAAQKAALDAQALQAKAAQPTATVNP